MRTIYCGTSGLTGQDNDINYIAELDGQRYRVTIHWDASYDYQSRAEVSVLEGLHWMPLLDLLYPELTLIVSAVANKQSGGWHGADPRPVRERLLTQQAQALVRTASTIIPKAAQADLVAELLAALEGVLQHCVTVRGFKDVGKGRTEEQQQAHDAARAAILKAKGGKL